MALVGISCSGCGSVVQTGARYCIVCGRPVLLSACASCGGSLQQGASFCISCGAPIGQPQPVSKTGAIAHLIVAIQMLISQSHPSRILESCSACLAAQPLPGHAALASVLSMSCYARLEKFPEAEAAAIQARKFYAAHLGLGDDKQAMFIASGHLIDDLQPIGNKDLVENPWLYLVLGHAYGPVLPNSFQAQTEEHRREMALRSWRTFFKDLTPIRHALSYLMFASGRSADAAKLFEGLSLIVREYEAVSPVRIEWVWPRTMLAECYLACDQVPQAIRALHSARSVDICRALDPDADDWSTFALPWIEKAKSRLAENRISIPLMEVSLKAAKHLEQAVRFLVAAEQYEEVAGDLEQNVTSIQRAGTKYINLLNSCATELQLVERLDTFTWAQLRFGESRVWYRFDSARGYLFHKFALFQLANDHWPLALADLKQAIEAWPMLSWCAVLGGLQMAYELDSEAKNTYRMCIERAHELTPLESSDACEEILREVRQALHQA